jgi:hypothetical protein
LSAASAVGIVIVVMEPATNAITTSPNRIVLLVISSQIHNVLLSDLDYLIHLESDLVKLKEN